MAKAKIEFKDVSYIYQSSTPLATTALNHLNLKIDAGSFTGLVGATGSGKSTLVNLIDGLIQPTSGQLIINNHIISNKTSQKLLDEYRKDVGFVFQFPERQLFAQTVREDISFGPENLGWSVDKVNEAVRQAAQTMLIEPALLDKSPFSLSGGQQRRVAIAGVLAMQPDILILDEPTVGLDSASIKQLMEILKQLNKEGITIIMITHYLELLVPLASQIVALHDGSLIFQGKAQEFFANEQLLKGSQLFPPESVQVARELRLKETPLSIQGLVNEIADRLRKGG
ncbi:ATP-binding cassette domain-containing protein [Lactobacillaceae bacterium 24-114]